jgi:uncharacterized integral membrane protein
MYFLQQIRDDPLGFVILLTGIICGVLIAVVRILEHIEHRRAQRTLDAHLKSLTTKEE